MSIKTIYALTICAVLLFMPTVSAQTEGAGDEVLFPECVGSPPVLPSWGLRTNVFKDRGHTLYISLPFDVKNLFSGIEIPMNIFSPARMNTSLSPSSTGSMSHLRQMMPSSPAHPERRSSKKHWIASPEMV